MSKNKSIWICVAMLLLSITFTGCGLKEGVLEGETKSYLWFTGSTKGAVVYIDDLTPITLKENFEGYSPTHYEVKPGKRSIVIKKNGNIVVDRVLLLGDGITKEISVP